MQDGTAAISQCAIAPGETFQYTFTVDRVYICNIMFLSSVLSRIAGPWALWYAKSSTHAQEVGLNSIPFRWIHEPQSLLINRRGQYNCSLPANLMKTSLPHCKFRGNEQCAPQIFHVAPNKTYRIRIASTISLASLNFAIG
ncbi:hypothetical protein VNO78_31800 [Psophocarpus tetragonolobus]|uniref:Plastocyanin-like domain-containing protein n=1 Tax=Psophocarpus tetragonolobus TaxID=3891 RepID=A0AAN9X830_PSOTE